MASNEAASRAAADEDGDLFVTEINLIYSGYLFFGRPFAPETLSTGETESQPLAAALFTSRRFLLESVEPILDGSLIQDPEPITAELTSWAEAAFSLPPEDTQDRLTLLARVLESDFVCHWSLSAGLPWSAKGLAMACRRIAQSPTVSLTPRDRIATLSQGIAQLSLSDIQADGDLGELSFTSDNPWISFELSPAVADASEICRLDLGFLSNDPKPEGILYLDYGTGFSRQTSIPLIPRGRSRYSAFLAIAALKSLRWKPDHSNKGGRITVLNARPVTTEELEVLALSVIGPTGLGKIEADMSMTGAHPQDRTRTALRLSRFLTAELGGHIDTSRDYLAWVRRTELSGKEAELAWRAQLERLPDQPLVIIAMVIRNKDLSAFEITASSILAQIYPNWRLEVAAPPGWSGADESLAHSECFKGRLQISEVEFTKAGAKATPLSSPSPEGVWSLQIEAGDRLAPNALLELFATSNQFPSAEIIYADEDRYDSGGVRTNPIFKPTFRPSLFLPHEKLGGFVVYRTNKISAMGGASLQSTDLVSAGSSRALRALDPSLIVHLPQILLHKASNDQEVLESPNRNAAGLAERKPALTRLWALFTAAISGWVPTSQDLVIRAYRRMRDKAVRMLRQLA